MIKLEEGQCGLCVHFGEEDPAHEQENLVQIRRSHEAPENFKETCGLPEYSQFHLMVTASSGCDAFEAAQPA